MKAVRYLPVLVVVALVALAPAVLLAMAVKVPATPEAAKSALRMLYLPAAIAFVGQLALAGAVAKLAADRPTQLRALPVALAGLAAGLPATLLVTGIVAIGSLALAITGLVLLVRFAPIAVLAVDAPDAFSAMTDTLARANWRRVAPIVAVALAVDLAIVVVASKLLVALPAKPKPADLAQVAIAARIAALGWVVAAPAVAIALTTAVDRSPRAPR